jgi:hypothetical protein
MVPGPGSTSAFKIVTGMTGIRSERTGVAWADETSWETERLGQEALIRSEGYNKRLVRWLVNGKEHEIGDKMRFNLKE